MTVLQTHIILIIIVCFHKSVLMGQQFTTNASSSSTPPPPVQTNTENDSSKTQISQEEETSFSLMLSAAEQKIISDAMQNDKNSSDESLICHYLGGIVYTTPTNWTLWFNDQTYSNASEIPGITILNVSSEGVNLKASDSKTKTGIWLKMNHTFCRDTGKISVGDQRR